jgi:SAM-dependent methyltransferase
MAENHLEFYKLAGYYDIAFGFRNVPAECDCLDELARRHGGSAPRSFLELAAGPARHALEFARRGIRVTALDSVPGMVDYALAAARTQNTPIDCVCADMVDFRLPQTYDLAALLMDSSSYLLDNEAVLRHLGCVADHLTPGGLYVIEMTHPRDAFRVGTSTHDNWDTERDGVKVSVAWGTEDDVFDPITQITEVTVTMRYESPEGSGMVTDRAPQRCFTANELRALITASGRFELAALLGAMDVTVPLSNEKAAWRMVPVLRKIR